MCVLLHGTGEGAFAWESVAPELRSSNRVIAIDLRGHGDSDWDPNRNYNIRTYVSDVIHVLDNLSAASVVLMGHSAGAAVAAAIAATQPGRVAGVVLVDYGVGVSANARAFATTEFLSQFCIYRSPSQYVEYMLPRRPLTSRESLEHLARRGLRNLGAGTFRLKCDPAVAIEDDELLTGLAAESALRAIACPTLLVRGRASAVLPARSASRTMTFLRSGQLETVDGAGHAVMADNPAAFTKVATFFLGQLR
jgi:pimeloyl-ACP methyl ester carboxylesterase